MKPAYVTGLGLWTPGHPSAPSWCRGDFDPSAETPPAGLLSGPLRRRATGLTRMAVEAFEQATRQAGCDPATIHSVWATSNGEHTTAIKILGMMRRGEGKLSPTYFHNSVHNTASGYASISTGNCAPSTTLTGGAELVASSLLEAICHLEASAEQVVLVLADEPLLPPFDRGAGTSPLALAFCLSSRPDGAVARLSGMRRNAVAPVKHHDRFGGLYVGAALPLLERIVLGRPGTVALELEGKRSGPVSCVDLELEGP
ncbi:MAG: beta-ketoacyl synthase chain length factor [Deltaproteobacteria bacterium]|nr:beta-ketoacyl synthase chain length factor [Deltaproteobacteria bacterium]